jgi:di/tricarboxylate transporter
MAMRPRALVLFWATTAAAMLLLGSVFSVAKQLGAGAVHRAEDVLLLAVAGAGLAGCLLVAGRITLVAARLRRDARRRPDPSTR